MTGSVIEHDHQVVLGVGLGQMFQEHLETNTVHPRQVGAEALSRRGIDRRVEVGPLVNAAHDPGRAESPRTIAPLVPVDQSEARLIEGQDLKRLLGMALAKLL